LLQGRDQPAELVAAGGDRSQHRIEVADHRVDDLVLGRQGGRQRADREDQGVEVRALALEHLDDLAGQLVDVTGREGLEERLEAVEQGRQVQRGGGPRQRDGSPGRQDPVGRPGALVQFDIALADEVEVLDGGGHRGGQRAARLHGEADEGQVPVVDADRGHVAHPHPGDVHVIAHGQPGDVGEHGLVAGGPGDPGVGDADPEHGGQGGRDHDEDDGLDQRSGD
jgi:hypothetical protein